MRRKGRQHGAVVPALAAFFCIGIGVGWWLRSGAPMPAGSIAAAPEAVATALKPKETGEVAATTGEPLVSPAVPPSRTSLPGAAAIDDLRAHDLRLPIDGADVDAMEGGFAEGRDGRSHEAVDILAPRNTLVRAVEDGTIAKLFTSKAGGITIYQFDPSGRFVYYYAHLEHYAPGLREGQHVSQGEVIGYVGTSGNAPPNTPHLHFAVFELDADRHWWKGRALDPYLIFRP